MKSKCVKPFWPSLHTHLCPHHSSCWPRLHLLRHPLKSVYGDKSFQVFYPDLGSDLSIHACVWRCKGNREKGLNWPEWSSFTRDDIVFVIESAATKRSFRRFLGTPRNQTLVETQVWLVHRHSELLLKSHPEQKPRARHPPPPPGSPAACGSGWSQLTWSGSAWAWSSRRCGWVRNGGIPRTATATQTCPDLSGRNTFPSLCHVLFPDVV